MKDWDTAAERDLHVAHGMYLIWYLSARADHIEVHRPGLDQDCFLTLDTFANEGSKIAIRARDLVLRSRFVEKINGRSL